MADDSVWELKKLIVETLKLEEITPGDIEDDGPLSDYLEEPDSAA